MIKISKMADYAIVVLATMDRHNGELAAACGLSRETMLPEPTVAKVLKLLCKGEVISSVRGAGGGYKLERKLGQISIAEIIAIIDGPIALTACMEGSAESCVYACGCSLKGRWEPVNAVVLSALEGIKLSDMLKTKGGAQ